MALALALLLSACATQKTEQKEPMPDLGLKKIEEPPPKSDGVVIPLAQGDGGEKSACYNKLGIPEYGGYFFSDEKAMAAAKLRNYAESTYIDAKTNSALCLSQSNIYYSGMIAAETELKEREAEDLTWWNQNKVIVGTVIGFFAGSAVTTVIVFGVNQAQRQPQQ